MMRHALSVVLGALVLGISSAGAQIWTFDAVLSADQEVPPTGSPATGRATGTYDQSTRVLRIMVNASGFESNLLFGHIHLGVRGQTGPIVFHLMNTSSDPRVWTSDNTFTLTAAQEADFLGWRYYVNLHTQTYASGAIRGQLEPVPEPASLLALSAGLLVYLRRRNH
jgi:hypothetical protein